MKAALANEDLDVRLFRDRAGYGDPKRADQHGQQEYQAEEPVGDHEVVATQAVN
jgi:hypothetical protein